MEDELREERDKLEQRVEARTSELLRANARLREEVRERRRAKHALRDSQQRLELALKGADLGLWDWNLKSGRVIWDERAPEILGCTREGGETGFTFWKCLVHPEDWPRVSKDFNDHIEGRIPLLESEFRLRAKSGEWKWILSRGKIVRRDVDNKPLHMAGTYLDITKRKSAEQERENLRFQLVQSQKMEAIGTLAAGIAHDFNNLLQVTLGYSELLLQGKQPDDPEYADLREIFRAASNGAGLAQKMLTFSRKVEPKPVPVNLNRQIAQVENLLRRTVPKMINIQIDLSADLADINADPGQIEQVLLNLAINARDAISDNGQLTLETGNVTLDEEYRAVHIGVKPGEYVRLAVSDTGHGMDEATIKHIFEPFYTTKEPGRRNRARTCDSPWNCEAASGAYQLLQRSRSWDHFRGLFPGD